MIQKIVSPALISKVFGSALTFVFHKFPWQFMQQQTDIP